MKIVRKIALTMICLAFAMPVFGALLPQIVGAEGAVMEMGMVSVTETATGYAVTCTPDTWADLLLSPIVQGELDGVGGACAGLLVVLEEAGIPLCFPVVWGTFLMLAWVVLELMTFVVDLVLWIPRRVKEMIGGYV